MDQKAKSSTGSKVLQKIPSQKFYRGSQVKGSAGSKVLHGAKVLKGITRLNVLQIKWPKVLQRSNVLLGITRPKFLPGPKILQVKGSTRANDFRRDTAAKGSAPTSASRHWTRSWLTMGR